MARITIEDCLERVENRYELVHLASKRVKQLREGADPQVHCKNKEIVTTLREISKGLIAHAQVSEYDSEEF
jgi:DNA-directed RNA polymerase subunit omega